jgi:hypothetical protein
MKNVLVISRKQKHLVALDRTPDRPSKLLLPIARIETNKCRLRSPQ